MTLDEYHQYNNLGEKYCFKNIRSNHGMTTPPRSNKRHQRDEAKESTFAFNVKHEIFAKNHQPSHDLERRWLIDSGASAHMTPFRKDCKTI